MKFLEEIVRGFEQMMKPFFGHDDSLTGKVLPSILEGGAHDEHGYQLGHSIIGAPNVYYAYGTTSKKIFAVKVFNDNDSYRRETVCGEKLWQGRTHDHVLLAWEFLQDPDRGYAVYPYLRGERLSSYAARCGALPAAEAATITAHVLDGLEFMHTYGVLHRDVKPENVMLHICDSALDFVTGNSIQPPRGRIKAVLHDFDVSYHASLFDLDKNKMFGTPSYMAPEIWHGNTLDPRSDIYAAGVLFYRLLTGTFPFRDDINASLCVQHLMTPPPTILLPDRNMSYALTQIVHKSLAKNPDFRYQSAREMKERLEDILGA